MAQSYFYSFDYKSQRIEEWRLREFPYLIFIDQTMTLLILEINSDKVKDW